MEITNVWSEYQRGVDFKSQINLYRTVDENIAFYNGDHWRGINVPNLPKPAINMIKRAGKFMVTQVKDRKLAIKYVTDGEKKDVAVLLNQMNEYARRTWNRLNMELKNLDGLIDAFNTGDYILYHWWNTDIETGQPFKGDLDCMLIDNVNYYPGNPNSNEVQTQPYIILVMRELVKEVRKNAKKNGATAEEIEMILPDEDTDYTAGDTGKIELTGGEKCNVLLKMWKQDGEVYFSKHTKHIDVQKPRKANLKLYPIAMMNWEPAKNCCHGTAEATYIKPNQVYINKQLAFAQLYLMQTAYPKVVFDKTKISQWTNKIASSIGVNGDITGVATYLQPPQMPNDVWLSIDKTQGMTMEMLGANDAALGNITNPNNKGAFIAVRDASLFPLMATQERYHKMMKDVGIIWADFWINHYPDGRTIPVEENGETVQIPFDLANYSDLPFDCQIEVGESQQWKELNVVYTLDNLLQQGKLKLSQYYKRMPQGYIPDKDELYREALADEEEQAKIQEAQLTAQQGGIQ